MPEGLEIPPTGGGERSCRTGVRGDLLLTVFFVLDIGRGRHSREKELFTRRFQYVRSHEHC